MYMLWFNELVSATRRRNTYFARDKIRNIVEKTASVKSFDN